MSETGKLLRQPEWNTPILGLLYKYCRGFGVDVGAGGGVLPGAMALEVGYMWGNTRYDGVELPFEDGALDFVYSSHMLEHTTLPGKHLTAWFRKLRIGGHLVLIVPHAYLYERSTEPPSKWNAQHQVFFTPANLLYLVELALPANHYRIRHFRDNDFCYNYTLTPDEHPEGNYHIELILEKIQPPVWQIEGE